MVPEPSLEQKQVEGAIQKRTADGPGGPETAGEIVESPLEGQSQQFELDNSSQVYTRRARLEFIQVHALMLYFTILLFAALWFFLDVWSNNLRFMQWMGVRSPALEEPVLRTIGFTMVGGFLGSVLFQIRLLFRYYLKSDAYDYRWMGKYISAPWESAIMAMIVLALIRGGVALFGGAQGTEVNDTNNFAAFGVGALVGFGMRDVVGWIGSLVRATFKTSDGHKTSSIDS